MGSGASSHASSGDKEAVKKELNSLVPRSSSGRFILHDDAEERKKILAAVQRANLLVKRGYDDAWRAYKLAEKEQCDALLEAARNPENQNDTLQRATLL